MSPTTSVASVATSPALPATRRYWLVSLILVSLTALVGMQIAGQTRFNVHPDETAHVHTFCYYETHWLPPRLNSPDVTYDQHGQSRVYSGEVVYTLFGQARAALARLGDTLARTPNQTLSSPCADRHQSYRFLNVLLLIVTLSVVFALGVRRPWAAALGLLMLGLPQVVYLYAYANSDAFSLSMCLFLMLHALTEPRPLASLPKTVLLGVLTALVILSKASYWITLFFAYGLLLWQLWRSCSSEGGTNRRALVRHGLALAAVVLALSAPLRIWFPLSQGPDFGGQVIQMMEEHAIPELKPSTAVHPTYHLRAKGVGFGEMLLRYPWVKDSGLSFYGLFGYMVVPAPIPAYALAAAMLGLNALLTLRPARAHWRALPSAWKVAVALGGVMSLGVALAAAYYSWIWDFQPQGRYLFPMLIPMALWFAGLWAWETPRLRALRLASAALLLALSFYTLWTVVLRHPLLV